MNVITKLNKEWLIEQYIVLHKSMAVMAVEIGVSETTIGRYLNKHNINSRSPREHQLHNKLNETYKLIGFDNQIFRFNHNVCGEEFSIASHNLSQRIKSRVEACVNCNPFYTKRTKDQMPDGYALIKIEYPYYLIHHQTCGESFKIRASSFRGRIKAGFELCHHCNPPIKSKKLQLPSGYELLGSNKHHRIIKHLTCDQSFRMGFATLRNRIKRGDVLCSHCNHVKTKIDIKDQLPNSYQILNKNKELYQLKHSCGSESIIHRRTISFRLEHGIEPCLGCVPFQRQYSESELNLVRYVESVYDGEILSGQSKFRHGLYTLDCYLPKLKLAFELNGDYFHANPAVFKPTDKIKNKTAKQIWAKDKKKMNVFSKLGIRIINVWESDWIENHDDTKAKILALLF